MPFHKNTHVRLNTAIICLGIYLCACVGTGIAITFFGNWPSLAIGGLLIALFSVMLAAEYFADTAKLYKPSHHLTSCTTMIVSHLIVVLAFMALSPEWHSLKQTNPALLSAISAFLFAFALGALGYNHFNSKLWRQSQHKAA